MATAKSLELRHVSKRYGRVDAVFPIDLSVRAGEFLTLLGPSGCGKTTLLRLVAGLEAVTGGAIMIGAEDVTVRPPHLRDTGIMFQDYALFPHKTITDNIAYGLKMRGVGRTDRRKAAAEWLGRIELGGYGSRLPHELSGGQRQRVALARALIVEPSVLLLDEPLGALDANLRRQMQVELKRIHREVGLTFVTVTHDQDEAMSMSDRIAVMNGGRIEQVADPETLYDRPATEFVARFVGGCNVLDATAGPVVDGRTRVDVAGLGEAWLPLGAQGAAGPVRVALRPEKIRLGPVGGGGSAGTVTERLFAGHAVRFRIALDGGVVLEAAPQRDKGFVDALAPGDRVALAWDPDAPTLLRPSGAAA
jgi:spermidine/putrescine ABC transporter ATP-binding subunit